ncbi:hypothetical protein RG2014_07 [Delftia phage RG-2014]|uniref:Uncharacterized protein n=1 Tax=Delftia phage RG-2014 TaxID=1563661 RepID=A0A097PAK3_9CAUD|nr:hypothetical protein RG2014_07 [Delftia phage RG-2014]AIU44260.2 hypothetical protein RG2014_07 [Delftia phage RG-2014]
MLTGQLTFKLWSATANECQPATTALGDADVVFAIHQMAIANQFTGTLFRHGAGVVGQVWIAFRIKTQRYRECSGHLNASLIAALSAVRLRLGSGMVQKTGKPVQ